YFNLAHLLRLSGPATVEVGVPFTVRAIDGQTGEPISGATLGEDVGGVTTTVPSSPLTNANGEAVIILSHTGAGTLKATRADSVRSNGLALCVHPPNDGSCGTMVPQPSPGSGTTATGPFQKPAGADLAEIVGVKSGHVYSRRHAPRILKGLVR